MAVFQNIGHMFSQIEFTKTGKELKDKADIKIKKLLAKIEERKERIKKIRHDYNITDAVLAELYRLQRQNAGATTYSVSNALVNRTGNKIGAETGEMTIPAGVVTNLDTENTAIGCETDQAERLQLLSRNIDTAAKHKTDFAELEYLEF